MRLGLVAVVIASLLFAACDKKETAKEDAPAPLTVATSASITSVGRVGWPSSAGHDEGSVSTSAFSVGSYGFAVTAALAHRRGRAGNSSGPTTRVL